MSPRNSSCQPGKFAGVKTPVHLYLRYWRRQYKQALRAEAESAEADFHVLSRGIDPPVS
jgi:hypothetical protein